MFRLLFNKCVTKLFVVNGLALAFAFAWILQIIHINGAQECSSTLHLRH